MQKAQTSMTPAQKFKIQRMQNKQQAIKGHDQNRNRTLRSFQDDDELSFKSNQHAQKSSGKIKDKVQLDLTNMKIGKSPTSANVKNIDGFKKQQLLEGSQGSKINVSPPLSKRSNLQNKLRESANQVSE